MKLFYKISVLSVFFILASCGGNPEKKDKPLYETQPDTQTKKETTAPAPQSSVPVDMSNKGIGPVTSYSFASEINEEMVKKGETLFKQKCMACHKTDKKLIGPPVKGIYERRSVEWVLNMMLNPDQMLKEDPIAIALLKEYNNTKMLDQNLTEEEAKALAEYFRTL
ncbi:c-type cytochrome [Abyssalbus ytuae]|uniref:Cytochrome c n=1 Tax=Abyssalbus ytuae TaxID=2926907 RepID=A0A9E7D3C7_9FLAO|nr:cytochrome c [Abyssalbus ytuae]UOB19163.1 cytochrome c [Abyssalbus ytuae]